VLPGALGAIALLTALFGFAVLPISWAGLALLILGAALLVIDAHVVSHGALTISGLTSIVVGSLLLFHNAPSPYNHVNVPVLVIFATGLGLIWVFAPVTGGPVRHDGRRGEGEGVATTWSLSGELWRAKPISNGPRCSPGSPGARGEVDPGLVRSEPAG
jgi:membrane-bound ClpP family serine protease